MPIWRFFIVHSKYYLFIFLRRICYTKKKEDNLDYEREVLQKLRKSNQTGAEFLYSVWKENTGNAREWKRTEKGQKVEDCFRNLFYSGGCDYCRIDCIVGGKTTKLKAR